MAPAPEDEAENQEEKGAGGDCGGDRCDWKRVLTRVGDRGYW